MVENTEDVIRILDRNWVKDGMIMHMAFTLRERESYISVNRTSVDSCDTDIESFVCSHPSFYSDDIRQNYWRALLNVGKIRDISVSTDELKLNIDVEVEPRDTFTKSHAGIFTRHEGKNIKQEDFIHIKELNKGVSADSILLEVRDQLLQLAELQLCNTITDNKKN